MSHIPPPQSNMPDSGQPPQDVYKPYVSPEPTGQSQKKGCLGPCLLGCLGIMLVSMLACGIGAWWTYANSGKLMVSAMRSVILSVVEGSELSREDKAKIVAQVDRVSDAYKQGKITFEDIGKVTESLLKSPLMPLLILYSVEEKYIKPSGLPPEEKEQASRTLQRIARGAYEQKFKEEEFEPLMDEVSYKQGNNQRQMKQQLTDAELRAFLSKAKKLADDKNIPEAEFKVDIGEEFKKAIDQALKDKGV